MTDEEVEEKARAEYDAWPLKPGEERDPYDQQPKFIKAIWREYIRGERPHPKRDSGLDSWRYRLAVAGALLLVVVLVTISVKFG